MKLLLISDAFSSGRIELSDSDLPVTVGRSTRADISISDRLLSRVHCEIRWHSTEGFQIVDLESTNLTIVNKHEVTSHTLQSGDCILLGDTEIYVDILKPTGGLHDQTTRELPLIQPASESDEVKET